ncbi:MAG TPA: arginine deiminase family protein [Rhizomicrobium sp.]|nr:arginine deiminase family protein [Rhizomicrobium sp.]
MRVFDFTHAIVRVPGRSVVDGLRTTPSPPGYEGVLAEHKAYVAALRTAGLKVDILPPLEAFPDSVFVEDPAFVVPEGAVLLRPGAPTRLGERDAMRGILARHFGVVRELGDGEFADGGDVLVTPQTVLIGLSKRTNRAGADALRARLTPLGRAARVVETLPGVLHFKTACALLDEETVLATAAMAASGVFAGLKVIVAPEDAAANSLRVRDTVFVGKAYPRTINMLARDYSVVTLPVGEIAKLDAGLSCMSLRW